MPAKLAAESQMTIPQFLAFAEMRPNGEKWELVEGVPVLSPSPTDWHQYILMNLSGYLHALGRARKARWIVLPGIGTRVPVSPNSLPQPDVMVMEHGLGTEPSPTTSEALVIFEILSKSNTRTDRAWRQRVYASVPNCRHYVTISQRIAEIERFDRDAGWAATSIVGLAAHLKLPALGADIAVPLLEIYHRTTVA